MKDICNSIARKKLKGFQRLLLPITLLIAIGFLLHISKHLPQSALAQVGEEGQVYIVQLDDTLWKVAEKYFGDGNYFDQIVVATRAKHAEDPTFTLIEDPNLIFSGSKLWIPSATSMAAVPGSGPSENLTSETSTSDADSANIQPSVITESAGQGPGGHPRGNLECYHCVAGYGDPGYLPGRIGFSGLYCHPRA